MAHGRPHSTAMLGSLVRLQRERHGPFACQHLESDGFPEIELVTPTRQSHWLFRIIGKQCCPYAVITIDGKLGGEPNLAPRVRCVLIETQRKYQNWGSAVMSKVIGIGPGTTNSCGGWRTACWSAGRMAGRNQPHQPHLRSEVSDRLATLMMSDELTFLRSRS